MPRSWWHATTVHNGGAQIWASAASSRALNAESCTFRSRALAIAAPSLALSVVADSERCSNRAHPALALSL